MKKPIYKSVHPYQDNSYEKFNSYERFKFMIDIMTISLSEANSMLDIGCSKGEFFYAIKDEFSGISCTGIEPNEELIKIGKSQNDLAHVNFIQEDALSFNIEKQFDIALMSGVLSLFDDIKPPLENMQKHIRKGGKGYIFSGFNSNDIDVIVRYRNNEMKSEEWESGLNMFSLKTVEKSLSKFSSDILFHQFKIPIDLYPTNNPIKSYTLNTQEQGRIILNGANIIRDFYFIEFEKR